MFQFLEIRHTINQEHDYFPYNPKKDVGETKNLASQYPKKVKALEALIEKRIKDMEAVVPAQSEF